MCVCGSDGVTTAVVMTRAMKQADPSAMSSAKDRSSAGKQILVDMVTTLISPASFCTTHCCVHQT